VVVTVTLNASISVFSHAKAIFNAFLNFWLATSLRHTCPFTHSLLNISKTIFAGTNWALNKPAAQISTWLADEASQAVDGRYDTVSCTHVGANSWWAVDLGTTHNIGHVIVTNDAHTDKGTGDFTKRLEQLFLAKLWS